MTALQIISRLNRCLTSDDVAALLRYECVRGELSTSGSSCPVAKLFNKYGHDVIVFQSGVCLKPSCKNFDSRHNEKYHRFWALAVSDFIYAYDTRSTYQDLRETVE